jgi:hypothetical protein
MSGSLRRYSSIKQRRPTGQRTLTGVPGFLSERICLRPAGGSFIPRRQKEDHRSTRDERWASFSIWVSKIRLCRNFLVFQSEYRQPSQCGRSGRYVGFAPPIFAKVLGFCSKKLGFSGALVAFVGCHQTHRNTHK